ncbi:MAG TPA: ROK family protein, partial [Thermodesulfovibrionales bacterium]|nr:ROK family protein [Thermodesulfovibrionales bacterium]
RLSGSIFSEDIAGIGLGIAGIVDREGGKITISPNIPAIEGIDLAKGIRERFRVPVFIENDANAAALGEKWIGAGKEFSDFVLFTLGTGIGGGIIKDKKLLDVAAEIGHMTINADGEKCHCGNSGCLEVYASARAIVSRVVSALEKGRESMLKQSRKGNFYDLSVEDIYRIALEGDSLARDVIKEAGRHLGIGIANIINVMSPGAIILAGGLTGAWDIYIQEAINEASKRAFKVLFDAVKIIPSLLGDDAGIIGSAGLVFHGYREV